MDLPRALVGWIEPIVERADELMVVTDISVASVRHCRRLIDFFSQDNPALPVEVVINHQREPFMSSKLHREVAKVLERPLKHWLPHDARAATAAGGRGEPLSRVAPRSPLGKAMSRLASATSASSRPQRFHRRSTRRSAVFKQFNKANNAAVSNVVTLSGGQPMRHSRL